MASTGEVYLGLYGDNFEPNDVSDFIGLTATSIRRKGERNPNVPLPRTSSWKFSLGKIEADVIDVYEMAENLVQRLRSYEAKIVEALGKFDITAELQVVLWIDQDESKSMPAIGFEREVLRFLNALDATIDIDTYRNS
jgi:hypothetical protein